MELVFIAENEMTKHPNCKECNKEIWGISHIKYTLGVERPVLLHSVCYERLLYKIKE